MSYLEGQFCCSARLHTENSSQGHTNTLKPEFGQFFVNCLIHVIRKVPWRVLMLCISGLEFVSWQALSESQKIQWSSSAWISFQLTPCCCCWATDLCRADFAVGAPRLPGIWVASGIQWTPQNSQVWKMTSPEQKKYVHHWESVPELESRALLS